MITPRQTMQRMMAEQPHWCVPLMDFVDDFRRRRDPTAVAEPFVRSDPQLDALLASVIEHLCREMGIESPAWTNEVPASPQAWFVSGLEDLKATAIVESPASFRVRRIFVLENFLSRV